MSVLSFDKKGLPITDKKVAYTLNEDYGNEWFEMRQSWNWKFEVYLKSLNIDFYRKYFSYTLVRTLLKYAAAHAND